MKNKILLLALFLVLFSGCIPKQQHIDINHYAIDFKSHKKVSQAKFSSIFIEEPNVNRSFNLTSIFYNTKPYMFEEYAKNRWIDLPSNMIYNQLIDSFNTSNLFANVVSKDKKISHEYTLKTEITKMYQLFEGDTSYAILKLKIDLVRDDKIVKTLNFDKKILSKTNDAYGFVGAINSGLEEVINSLLEDLASNNYWIILKYILKYKL